MTMLRMTGFALFLLAMTGPFSGCYYDVEEDLYPFTTCDTTGIRFSVDVQPVLNQQCNVCHNNALASGGVILDTHAGVKAKVDDNRLLGAIRHEAGFSAMPQGQPQMDACTIEKIAAWAAAGAPNN